MMDINSENANGGSLFANRCKSLPVVNSTCFWLNEYYNRLKDRNVVAKYAIIFAETTIKTSIVLANPFVEKFKDKFQTLDTIACSQLDKLEAAFPIILKDTDQIVNYGKECINKSVYQPAVDKLNTIKTNTGDKYLSFTSSYGLITRIESIKHKNCEKLKEKTNEIVNKMIDYSERFIETHIYEGNDLEIERLRKYYQENMSTTLFIEYRIARKLKIVTCMLYYTIQKKCLKQINYLIKSLDNYLGKFLKLVDLIDVKKRNVACDLQDKLNLTKEKIEFYKDYVELIIKQLIVQEGRSLEHVASVEEQMKIIIRRSVGNFFTILNLVYSRVNFFPPSLRTSLTVFVDNVCDLYRTYNQREAFNGLSDNMLDQCRVLMNRTQITMFNLMSNLSKSSTVTWMVPNFEIFGILDESGDEEITVDDMPDMYVLSNHGSSQSRQLMSLYNHVFDDKDHSPMTPSALDDSIKSNYASSTSANNDISISSTDDQQQKSNLKQTQETSDSSHQETIETSINVANNQNNQSNVSTSSTLDSTIDSSDTTSSDCLIKNENHTETTFGLYDDHNQDDGQCSTDNDENVVS